MPKVADLLGIVGSTFTIGSRALGEGVRRLAFRSGSFLGTIDWNVTANRTINLPNATGTVLLDTTATIAGSLVNPVGVNVVDFSIPAGVRRITFTTNELAIPYGNLVRLGTSSGVLTTGYRSDKQYIAPGATNYDVSTTVGLAVPRCNAMTNTLMTFYRMSPNVWIFIGHSMEFSGSSQFASGNVSLPGELTIFRYISTATISSGSIQLLWEF